MSVYIAEEAKKELMIKVKTDNCDIEKIIPQDSNREKIAKILEIVGIGDLSYCERASWDILMTHMRVHSFFAYYRLVPKSNNAEQIMLLYRRDDITNYSDTQGNNIIAYEGDELKCSVDLKDAFKIVTITFNGKIVYKATYPKNEECGVRGELPYCKYATGMSCEVDERTPLHPVYNFIEKLIQLALKLNWKKRLTMEEMEKEWYLFAQGNLCILFDFGNYKHCFHLNLNDVLKNPLSFSYVCFEFNDTPNN